MSTTKIVNSIVKSGDILKSLSNGIDRISDLSVKNHLSKSTTHRLLKTLEASDLVMQDPITRRYYLGPLILEIASKYLTIHQNLIISSFEKMRFLRDLSRETVSLYIRVGLERVCIEELHSPETIKFTLGKGSIAPIYSGSAGKILLSELGESELQLILRNIKLVPVGPNTITDKKILLKEVEKIRKQGYAMSFGERVPGSASISVPIKNYICPVALTVVGPENRFSLDKMMNVLKEMKQGASRISKKLSRIIKKSEFAIH